MGGAPPPRLAVREPIPLPPTLQPQFHIFSHIPVSRPSFRPKRPSASGFSPTRRTTAQHPTDAIARAAAPHAKAVADRTPLAQRAPARIRSPSPARLPRRREDPRIARHRPLPPPFPLHPSAAPRRSDRCRRGVGPDPRGAARRLRVLAQERQRHRTGTRGPGLGRAIRQRRSPPGRLVEGRGAVGGPGAHPPGRPVPAPAFAASHTWQRAAELREQSRALAGTAGGSVRGLAAGIGHAADAA